jgi:phenylacetate-CoA ligase
MPWNDKFECMPVEELKKFQLEKLKETVAWVSEKVPFYKNKFKEMGIKAGDLKSLEDIAKLPFTVKNDLRDNYPFGLCAVPSNGLSVCVATSGLPECAKRTLFKMPMDTAFLPAD